MFIGFSEAESFLRNCRDAVIITHQSPDGDCIGAGFGLKDILAELGIRSRVVCSDPFPKRYDFMTSCGAGEDFEPETIIAVDIADEKLMGRYEAIYGGKVQLCIDHHISNKNYAEKTLLRGNATAACEIIYDLAQYMGVRITKHCATCLYTGIATDSGCFKYDCTTPRAHEIAAEMKRSYDINFARINRYMFDVKSMGRMKLEAKVTELMEERLGGKLVLLAVTQDMMKQLGVAMEELEGFAPLTIQLENTEVGVLMREREDGVFKCSFRSADEVNVSEICQTLGGGGHAKAAGCTVEGSVSDIKDTITEAVRKAIGS
ncbi:bifunctional oligoribonuclease/PAP phosphatase NrnA [Ruminococcus sp. XPD3002]|uniref:DHH family phosphoesterase n=1 Tax=Ruminococcus sp. XPD3002 TaxID=1452269 RepID=UPI00091F106F|nr:DHH family phosphoesterase [Ruminococcus sp.]SFY02525.1 phosphoesterase RecJ domain-containing protein [Ruminococcus flavefaciens]